MNINKSLPVIILTQKVNNKKWKKTIILEDFSKLDKFIYKPKNKIEQLIYKNNKKIINNIIKNQQHNKLNVDKLYKINKLIEKIISNNNLTEKEILKLKSYKNEILEFIDCSFIGELYYPQITIDNTYNRLYFHPIYKFDKLLLNLLLKTKFCKYYLNIDINAGILRVALLYLYKLTNNNELINIYNSNKDIYSSIIKDEYINKRSEIKKYLISFINKPTNKLKEYLNSTIKYDYIIDLIEKNISNNIHMFRKIMTLYFSNILVNIQDMLNNYYPYYLFINFDGGLLVLNSEIDIKTLKKLNKITEIKIINKNII